jgi:predicted DNA-binding transcriptional regulator YafY
MPLHYFNRLERIDYLISSRQTGKPAVFAERLGISERALYDFLNMMRSLGAPIQYNKYAQTYYYSEPGGFYIRFKKATPPPIDN